MNVVTPGHVNTPKQSSSHGEYVKIDMTCVYIGEDARNALAYLRYPELCLLALDYIVRYSVLVYKTHPCI